MDCRAGQPQWLLYTEVQGRCQHPSFRMLPAGQYRCRLENWKLDPIGNMNLLTFMGLIVCEDIPGQNEEGLNIEIQMFEAKPRSRIRFLLDNTAHAVRAQGAVPGFARRNRSSIRTRTRLARLRPRL